ncbi:membrane protein [Clostridium polyendosporum]|uniref:Membrane protein n=1 Tax=Clostridium polyendosporum TaxID=69208 RepID=A0A919RZX5_9CLOT|nr:phage holin family protein [Clostridium polyendosporum]GIM29562.1 membrane protein [Clostridium polyendosporum]
MGHEDKRVSNDGSILGAIVRFIVTIIVLAITSYLTPGFSIVGLWSYILAALVISLIDYAVERVMGVDASPFGKGFKGFVISVIILYAAQFIVPGMRVTLLGAIIASIVIGIVDAIIPGRTM